jgi:hypothetical protein
VFGFDRAVTIRQIGTFEHARREHGQGPVVIFGLRDFGERARRALERDTARTRSTKYSCTIRGTRSAARTEHRRARRRELAMCRRVGCWRQETTRVGSRRAGQRHDGNSLSDQMPPWVPSMRWPMSTEVKPESVRPMSRVREAKVSRHAEHLHVRKLRADARAVIARAAVHHQNFNVFEGLASFERLRTTPQRGRGVVRDYDQPVFGAGGPLSGASWPPVRDGARGRKRTPRWRHASLRNGRNALRTLRSLCAPSVRR